MNRTYFRFPVTVVKNRCYEETVKRRVTEDGVAKESDVTVRHLVAVASSDSLDSYREYFSLSALQDMVKWAREKKELIPEEGVVELRETHWETFAIGTIVDGWLIKNSGTGAIEFFIDIALKGEDVWPANELYTQVKNGTSDKQLSVGGWIDWDASDDAFEWEDREFTDEESNTLTTWVGRINNFILEHVAVTLNGFAANDDTRFLEAMVKSFSNKEFQNKMHDIMRAKNRSLAPNTKSKDKGSEDSAEVVLLKDIKSLLEKNVVNKESEVPDMADKRKAKKAADLLRERLAGLSAEEVAEVLREANIPGLTVKSDGEGDTGSEGDTTDTSTADGSEGSDPEGGEEANKGSEGQEPDTTRTTDGSDSGDTAGDSSGDGSGESDGAGDSAPESTDTGSDGSDSTTDVEELRANLATLATETVKGLIDELKASFKADIASLRDEVVKTLAEGEVAREKMNNRVKGLEKSHGVLKSGDKEMGDEPLNRSDDDAAPEEDQSGGLWTTF